MIVVHLMGHCAMCVDTTSIPWSAVQDELPDYESDSPQVARWKALLN